MNRRTFMQGTLLIPTAMWPKKHQRYGLMTIFRYQSLKQAGTHLRILVDGIDVTNHCRAAHDIEGWAIIFKTNESGHHYIENGEVAKATLRGKVEFVKA